MEETKKRVSPSEEGILPHITMEFTDANSRAFDFGFCGSLALATSHVVNFFYYLDNSIHASYSISPSNSTVTALRFHRNNPTIAIGTADGSIFLFDTEKRTYLGFILAKNEENSIQDIIWIDAMIIVLFKKQKITAFTYSTLYQTKSRFNITSTWEFILPCKFDRMALDVTTGSKVLLSSSDNSFISLDMKEISKPPLVISNTINLNSSKSTINDAQYSFHIPGCIFIVMDSELLMYDSSLQLIVPVFQTQRVGICFMQLYQLINDHSRIFLRTRSGSFMSLIIQQPFQIELESEFTRPSHDMKICSCATSLYDDSVMALFVNPLGVMLYDLKKKMITNVAPLQSARALSVANNNCYCVAGMNNGTVVIHDIFDHNSKKVYKVSQGEVQYVFITDEDQIYWHSEGDFGTINIEKHCITRNNSKSPIMKLHGSNHGGLIVQRSSTAFGIFINGREYPLLLKSPAISLAFNSEECCANEGSFAVLVEPGDLYFYKYSMNGVPPPFLRLRPFGATGSTNCIAWSGDTFATGTQLGTISLMNLKAGSMQTFAVSGSVTSLQIQGNRVFGIAKNKLFTGPTDIQSSSFVVDSFQATKDLPLLCLNDGYAFYVSPNGFKIIAERSKANSIPSQSIFIQNRLKNHMHTSQEARDLILSLQGNPSLRSMFKSCIGDTLKASQIELSIATSVKSQQQIFQSLLFLNNFEEAGNIMFEGDGKSGDFLSSIALGITAFSASQTGKYQNKIIDAANKLFEAGNEEQGMLLMLLGKANKEGFHALIQKKKIVQALKFVRLLEGDEKKECLFEAGSIFMNEGSFVEAALLFAAAGEGHAVLFSLFSLGNILDCYVARIYLNEKGMLAELPESKKSVIHPIELEDLNNLIDTEFANYLQKTGIML